MADPKKSAAQLEAETQDEIAEIMSEIENLQQTMNEAPAEARAEAEAAVAAVQSEVEEIPSGDDVTLEDFRGGSDEPSMEETLAGMKEEPATGGLLGGDEPSMSAEPEESEVKVSELKRKPAETGTATGEEGTLTLSLSGSMTLKLRYEYNGQDVTVGFVDDSLRVELSDGTEFKIPVGRRRSAA